MKDEKRPRAFPPALYKTFVVVGLSVLLISVGVARGSERGSAGASAFKNVGRVQRFQGRVEAVAILGAYAYIGAGQKLIVLDVSNPIHPSKVGQTASLRCSIHDIHLAGDYAYVTTCVSLEVIDITRFTALEEVGAYELRGEEGNIYVAGNHVYLAAGHAGLRIIDVSEPSTPMEVGSYEMPAYAADVYVAGHLAYATDVVNGLWVVDVSDPLAPATVSTFELPGARKVQVVSDPTSGSGQAYAYVIAQGSELHILDVSDPTAPVEVGAYEISGDATDLDVVGVYAYVAAGDGLRIIDVSDPAAPAEIGAVPQNASAVDVADRYAFVVGDGNLWVADISTPAAPVYLGTVQAPASWNVELIGHIGGSVNAIVAQGNHIYAGIGPRFVILDVSDPGRLIPAGQPVVLPGLIRDIHLASGYAFVAADNSGLRVVDISNPALPEEVGGYDTPGTARGVHVLGRYAYVADGYGGLRVLDITDPTTPRDVGVYETQRDSQDIFVSSDPSTGSGQAPSTGSGQAPSAGSGQAPSAGSGQRYAYLIAGPAELQVIDVSDPTSPIEVATYSIPGGYIRHIYLVEAPSTESVFSRSSRRASNSSKGSGQRYAYIAAGGAGLRIIDVSIPATPREVGAYYNDRQYVMDVHIAGEYAYVAVGYAGLQVMDVSDPAVPREVGAYEVVKHIRRVHAANGYAYLALGEAGLQVIDVSDSSAPVGVSAYKTLGLVQGVYATHGYAYTVNGGLRVISTQDPIAMREIASYDIVVQDIDVVGDYAYVAAHPGLRIMDMSDPRRPKEIAAYDMDPGHAWDIDVAGDYVYTVGDRLRIIDISVPANPKEAGSLWLGSPRQVYVAGHYAYVANGRFGFRIIDVSDPTTPTEVNTSTYTGGDVSSVYAMGDYAYVAWGAGICTPGDCRGGLRIFDISNPTVPRRIGAFEIPDRAVDVHVTGRYAYLTAGSAGLRVVDVSDPTTPREVGAYETPGSAQDIHVAESYIYGVDGNSGLFVFRFAPSKVVLISPKGGELVSSIDQTTYTFAAGTFSDTVVVTHMPRYSRYMPPSGRLVSIGHVFEVKAAHSESGQSAQPIQPYTITIGYTDAERTPAVEHTLALYNWDSTRWVKEPTSQVDPESNAITATPAHFGLWAVFGETRQMFLPTIFRTSDAR